MHEVDARIDDADDHAVAPMTGRSGVDGVGSDLRQREVEVTVHRSCHFDAPHFVEFCQPIDLPQHDLTGRDVSRHRADPQSRILEGGHLALELHQHRGRRLDGPAPSRSRRSTPPPSG